MGVRGVEAGEEESVDTDWVKPQGPVVSLDTLISAVITTSIEALKPISGAVMGDTEGVREQKGKTAHSIPYHTLKKVFVCV